MRWGFVIGFLVLLMGCSTGKMDLPEEGNVRLQMATHEVGPFENYIHSLGIYAFRKSADHSYVYSRTLAELEEGEIAGLQDGSVKGDSKLFKLNLPVGTYELYMIGNAGKRFSEGWVEDRTVPSECKLTANPHGQDSVFFLGKTTVVVVTDQRPPIEVTLERAVSKLVWVLYGVPLEIDSVQVSLGNLATEIDINGIPSGKGKVISEISRVNRSVASVTDTLVGEIVTFPSLGEGAPLQLTFYAENGQEKIKEMPLQTLLPNKYIRVVGEIDDGPGGLLQFEIKVRLLIFDYFLERPLPDFTLNKRE